VVKKYDRNVAHNMCNMVVVVGEGEGNARAITRYKFEFHQKVDMVACALNHKYNMVFALNVSVI